MSLKKDVFRWGPPVFKYKLNSQEFENLLKLKPKINYSQGKNKEFNGVETIDLRFGYEEKDAIKIINILSLYFDDYIETITGEKKPYIINKLWGNRYKSNHYIGPHIHPDCDIAFILYIKSNQELIDNKDDNPDAGYTMFQYGNIQDSRAVIPCISNVAHRPQDGELIVFPNNLTHYTVPFNTPGIDRYTLSGNLDLKI